MLDKTSSIICAFGLASAAPRSPYRHLELCGIASVLFSGCFRGRSGTSLKILFDLGHLLIYGVEAQNHSNNKHESQRSNGCKYTNHHNGRIDLHIRTTEITADEFYVAVLSNEAKVVLAKFKA